MNNINEIQAFTGAQMTADVVSRMPEHIRNTGIQMAGNRYITAAAVQRPRSLTAVSNSLYEEARLAGEDFFYAWNVKMKNGNTKEVKGGSIGLAMSVFRNYMNCFVDVEYEELPDKYILTGVFVDLENGVTFKRMYSQRKRPNIGPKMGEDRERMDDITFQIAQSKAIRNVVLSVAPQWMVDEAIRIARDTAVGKLKAKNAKKKGSLKQSIDAMLEFFKGYSVTVDMIEYNLSKKIKDLDEEDTVTLRSAAKAIKDGTASARSIFIDPWVEKMQLEAPTPAPTHDEPADIFEDEVNIAMEKNKNQSTDPPREMSDNQRDTLYLIGSKIDLTNVETRIFMVALSRELSCSVDDVKIFKALSTEAKFSKKYNELKQKGKINGKNQSDQSIQD